MKNKGFTLIELLAVIVILAIIALIAVPIILNIINDAKEQTNKRSVELYGKAVENAIAKAQLTGEVPSGEYTQSNDGKTLTKGTTSLTIDYSGNKVVCTTNMLYEDGKIYLAGCTINGKGPYTYGEEQTFSPKLTRYYSWTGSRIGENLPDDAKTNLSEVTTLPNDARTYLAYDSEDGETIKDAYVCFVRNDTEYCVKQGNSTDDYNAYVNVMKTAFADVIETNACSISDNDSSCAYDNIQFGFGGSTRIDLYAKYNYEYMCNFEGNNYIGCEYK